MKGVDFGRKYEFKVDSNPVPGQYNTESSVVKTKSVAATIRQPTSSYRRPQEASPEPGQYQSKTITMGDNMKGIDMGKKYEFKPDTNPAPGQYNIESGVSMTKERKY